MFKAYQDKGFQISFANGLTMSVVFGKGNYCEHRHAAENSPDGSKDAEFAIWETGSPRGGYVFADGYEYGTGYTGWISPEHIAKSLAVVAEYKEGESRADLVAKLMELQDTPPELLSTTTPYGVNDAERTQSQRVFQDGLLRGPQVLPLLS